jgi:hypothetical protein
MSKESLEAVVARIDQNVIHMKESHGKRLDDVESSVKDHAEFIADSRRDRKWLGKFVGLAAVGGGVATHGMGKALEWIGKLLGGS